MHPTIRPRTFWPLGITLACCLYVGGVGVCSFLACTHRSELVSNQYYEQEIKYQSRIDSLVRTRQLATRASATYDNTAQQIIIALPLEHAGRVAHGGIDLYRPSAAGLDRKFKLEPDTKGVQTLDAAALPHGLWRVRVNWDVAGQEFYFDQKLAVGPADVQAKLVATTGRAGMAKQ